MVAQAIHDSRRRADHPLVTLECAGLTESLFESEMFGHVKGAFTGANYAREGLAASASGGMLFLDEIGDVPYPLPVKLLRLLETGLYRPVGSTQPRRTDFRLICATYRNLEKKQHQVTVLDVRMRDQAQLMGALESLHHLHLPIISVTREAD